MFGLFTKKTRPKPQTPNQNTQENIVEPIKTIATKDTKPTIAEKDVSKIPAKNSFSKKVKAIFTGQQQLDDTLKEQLEDMLIMADVGMQTTNIIVEKLAQQAKTSNNIHATFKQIILELLQSVEQPLQISPTSCMLIIGVNGVGKTSTIAKVAQYYKQLDKKVMLAAGDTFRAAAIEQLQYWGKKMDIQVIAQKQNSDSASVIFDAYQSARANSSDILLADTAGRLHNNVNLIAELAKITRVVKKIDENAPHEKILVLDGNSGLNSIKQFEQFHQAIGITGIIMTKLDGNAKGGVLLALAQYNIPIYFCTYGEGIDDIQPFNAQIICDSLIDGVGK